MYSVKPCAYCGRTFSPNHSQNNHCSVECRFFSYVVKGSHQDCWDWTGARSKAGYGVLNIGNGKLDYAHRMMFALSCGDIPDGLHVCHRCDNPRCINPSHLFLGTARDNVHDMWAKGRQQTYANAKKGSGLPQAKTTEEVVKKAKRLLAQRVPREEVAHICSLTIHQIHQIAQGKTWKHV